jgi:Cdc6-like AAA superfamily ATPase
MVGPRGVGKTSLLAAMYEKLESELKECGCGLSQEAGPTQVAINEQLRRLRTLANSSGLVVKADQGIAGSDKERRYTFHLNVVKGDASTALEFVDLPGDWYIGKGEFKTADEVLKQSHVSLLAVDATALMEHQSSQTEGFGKFHKEINDPTSIRQSYKRVFSTNTNPNHTVILVLIRAETYVDDIDALFDKTRRAYLELARDLAEHDVPLYACHVNTVGCLIFNAFEEEDDKWIATNFRRNPKIGYKPDRCDIPLRLAAQRALHIALDTALEDMVKEDHFWAKLLAVIGLDFARQKAKEKYEKVYEALTKIGARVKPNDTIRITP